MTCPSFIYPRETIFGAAIKPDHLHHPIVRGLPGAFRMPRGKYMCDEKEWRRCVWPCFPPLQIPSYTCLNQPNRASKEKGVSSASKKGLTDSSSS